MQEPEQQAEFGEFFGLHHLPQPLADVLGGAREEAALVQRRRQVDGRHDDAALTLHLEPDAGHGHIDEPSDPTARRTIDAIADWLGR